MPTPPRLPSSSIAACCLAVVAAPALMLAASLVLSPVAQAQPLPESEVPPALRSWIPWALDGSNHRCAQRDGVLGQDANPTFGGGEPVCLWPGDLSLVVAATGGTFSLDVTSDARLAQPLPGSGQHWPIEVRVDGQSAVVLALHGQPVVWLPPGTHRVEGRFAWSNVPDTLAVPDVIARVALTREGVSAVATRGSGGEIWLRGAAAAAAGEEEVGLEVHRRIQDGSPLELSTRIVVRAAGRARELRLPNVLPQGVVPVEVSAELPVRLLASGELSIQLRAGTYEISIRALAPNPETAFRRPALPAPWPEQEVWVWSPDEAFRQVEIQGAPGIDPQRTSLPDAWRTSSAYLLDASTTLTLHTVRRGEATPPPNLVGITRELWLDVDGRGYTARDQLDVEMHSTHRLSLRDGELGRVSLDGQDQLVTEGEDARPGIELRDTSRSFTAEWRMQREGNALPAVNWSENASRSSTTLHVPPGWTLVHASGVDRAPGTWLDRWTLLGVFALLLISAAVGRAYGWHWGLVALVGVGLAFHELDAPQWLWLVLAALMALHRALGTRAIERVVRWAYVAVALFAVVVVVWFSAGQLRNALYPQLATPSGTDGLGMGELSLARSSALVESAPAWAPTTADESYAVGHGGGSAGNAYLRQQSNSYWLDPNAVVQTGFGLPSWAWSRYELNFEGPVAKDHQITLHLLAPWAFRLASFARAALLLGLLAIIVLRRPRRPGDDDSSDSEPAPMPPRDVDGTRDTATRAEVDEAQPRDADAPANTATTRALSGAIAMCLFVVVSLSSTLAYAQAAPEALPDDAMLTELRERVTRQAPCGERCSEANHMQIHIAGDVLRIVLDVSAANTSAYPLPGPSEAWVPSSVSIDGVPTRALVRLDNGFLHVRVPPGAHVVTLEGRVAGRDAVTLALGRPPRALEVSTEGWEASGQGADDRVAESIQLRRTLDRDQHQSEERSELPAWLEVQRTLDIGVRWTVRTTVTRRSPANAPAVARVALLAGERVTDAGVTVENGQVLVTLGQRDTEASWTSVLEPSDAITLRAPAQGDTNEVWVLSCSPLWHCETPGAQQGGLAPTSEGVSSTWRPTFHPWPGESLTVTLSRPEPADGQSLTVDSARLDVTPGVRLTSSSLSVRARSSVSAPFAIDLPEDANIQSLIVDGQSRPIQRDGTRLTVALQPGTHDLVLAWQTDTGWRSVLETPRVSLGAAAVNVDLHVALSSDRWILWLGGPAWGPAVLFWPYLALAIVLALALASTLGRLRGAGAGAPPLRPHDWLLLLVGLTQIPAVPAVIVVLWFFLLSNRRTDLAVNDLYFAARQLVILGYTLLAFGCLVWAVDAGLLGAPAMDIAGPQCSSSMVRYFVDRTDAELPVATVVSLPIWVYRVVMFAWALWLAVSLLRWARWGWECFKEGGLFRLPHFGRQLASTPATSSAHGHVDPDSGAGAGAGTDTGIDTGTDTGPVDGSSDR